MSWLTKKIKSLGVFDRIVILIGVFVVAFFGYVFFRKSEFITVTVKIGEENVNYEPWFFAENIFDVGRTRVWFAQLFNEGMKEADGLGRTMAELVSIRAYDTRPSRKAVYLTVRVNAVYSRSSGNYTFKGRPLLVGSTIKLNLDNLFVEGLVTHIDGARDSREKVKLIVEARVKNETAVYPETSGTSPYIAEALTIGQEIKDSQNNIIIKIINKKVENAKRSVATSDGRMVIQTNPLRKDVYLTLEVNALKIANRYYIF